MSLMPIDKCGAVAVLELGLQRRTESLGNGDRRGIRLRNHADRSGPTEVLVCGPQAALSGFGGVTVAVVTRHESPGDFGLDPTFGEPQSRQSDKGMRTFDLDRPRTVPAERPMAGERRELSPRLFSIARAAVILRNGIGVKRRHDLEIVLAKLSQQQSFSFESRYLYIHWAIIDE
jgi:hypothetical protein